MNSSNSCCLCWCDKERRIKASFIIIMICGAVNFLLSLAQLFMISNKELKQSLSKYKVQKNLLFVKTILTFLYNLYLFVFGMIRLKFINKYCKFGILFSFFLLFGNFLEYILTAIAIVRFGDEYKDYDWIENLNLSIFIFINFSVIPTIYLFFELLCSDCVSNNCIDKIFFCICSSLYKCNESCCNLFNGCCISCGEYYKKCSGKDYSNLREVNHRLNDENNNLKKNKENLEKVINN